MANQKQALAVSDFCEALGHRMRNQRRSKRLSFEQLSALSGLVAADLERYESGAACPFADEALAIADALGISLDALLGRE
jgi:transcriptional regulator with XRE-family HTH domain